MIANFKEETLLRILASQKLLIIHLLKQFYSDKTQRMQIFISVSSVE